jgi:hypothetical protein
MALGSHLRKLVEKNSISGSDCGKYKKADAINFELVKNGITYKTPVKNLYLTIFYAPPVY